MVITVVIHKNVFDLKKPVILYLLLFRELVDSASSEVQQFCSVLG